MKRTGVSLGVAALLALFFLASCIDTDSTLGSAMVADNQDVSLHSVTLDLPVTLRMADSLQTSVSNSATLGAIRTDRYGLFHSDAAFSLTAAADSIIWGKNPSVRALSLSLTVDTTIVIDASQLHIPQNFYVYQLNRELDSTMVYNNSLTPADHKPELLSEAGSVYTGDASYIVSLKKEFGEQLFKIPMSTLDSAELFMKACYGLYLQCDDPLEGTEGGRLTCFDLSSSYLYLTYDYDDEDGHRRTSTANFSLGQYFSVNICSSGSRDLEHADPAQALYMEGLCGIKPHIDAQQLRKTVADWAASTGIPLDNLLIAKATVTFPVEYNGDRNQYDYYSDNLFPCQRKRGTSKVSYTPLEEINNDDFEDGTLDRSLLQYTSNISLYLQDLVGRTDITSDDDLWMMPTVTYYDTYSGVTYYFADYYYYAQDILNGTAADRHPVLKLTYAVLK